MSPVTDLYVDFLCPYAWRGVELAAVLRAQGEGFRLRHFSLVEGNHADNTKELNWRITDQPPGEGNAWQQDSLRAFLAAQAAANQGEDAAWTFSLALYRLKFEGGRELDESSIGQAARDAGLDLAQFAQDRQDETGLRTRLRAELDGAREVGVFGTPTFVLSTGEAAYYRFENLTRDPAQARAWWNLYVTVLTHEAGIGTIKRAKNRPPRKI